MEQKALLFCLVMKQAKVLARQARFTPAPRCHHGVQVDGEAAFASFLDEGSRSDTTNPTETKAAPTMKESVEALSGTLSLMKAVICGPTTPPAAQAVSTTP